MPQPCNTGTPQRSRAASISAGATAAPPQTSMRKLLMSRSLFCEARSRSPRIVGTVAVNVGWLARIMASMPAACRCGPGMMKSLPLSQPL